MFYEIFGCSFWANISDVDTVWSKKSSLEKE
jgi:hypothetical protein